MLSYEIVFLSLTANNTPQYFQIFLSSSTIQKNDVKSNSLHIKYQQDKDVFVELEIRV